LIKSFLREYNVDEDLKTVSVRAELLLHFMVIALIVSRMVRLWILHSRVGNDEVTIQILGRIGRIYGLFNKVMRSLMGIMHFNDCKGLFNLRFMEVIPMIH
jgi:hypothetical protein